MMREVRVRPFLIIAILGGVSCSTSEPAEEVPSERVGAMLREIAETPIPLTGAPGTLHQKVTTSSVEAQAYYDQGIAYLAGYVWIDAARSFNAALRLDEEVAMAHVGLAKAYFGAESVAASRRHIDRAQKLAAAATLTKKEELWIALAEQQLDAILAAEESRVEEHQAYKRAIEELISLDLDDAHAWVLRGNAEERGAWGRGQMGGVGAVAFYEAALRRDPDHVGAHHFLVHAFENLRRYPDAARHGERYASLAPGVPHAQHMYGHVLPRVDRWDEALAQFQVADEQHRQYFAKENISSTEDWHYPHNLHALATVYLRLGRPDEAGALYRELFDTQYVGFRGGGRLGPWVGFLILQGRHEDALRDARRLEARGQPMARLVGLAYQCEALVRLGRLEEARAVRVEVESAYQAALDAAPNPLLGMFASRQGRGLLEPLDGLLALHGENPEEGRQLLLSSADAIAARPTIDGWATGMFHLARLAEAAEQVSMPDLAADLRARIAQIDPAYATAELEREATAGR